MFAYCVVGVIIDVLFFFRRNFEFQVFPFISIDYSSPKSTRIAPTYKSSKIRAKGTPPFSFAGYF